MSFVAVAVTGVAVSAATAAVSLSAQQKAANEQNRYRRELGISQNTQYAQNAAAVVQDVGLQIDQLARREIEFADATRLELESVSRNVREASATSTAAMAAAGIEGRSVDLLHNQFSRDVAEFESVAAKNLSSFRAQSAMEAAAIYARGQNAINGGYPPPLPPVATVSPATSILGALSSGLSAASMVGAFRTPSGVGGAATGGVVNNPNAPYYLQAAPTTSVGTPALLAAPAPTAQTAPFFLAR